MTTATKEAIRVAIHDLALAKQVEQDATAARLAANQAFYAAQAVEQVRRAEYQQAEARLTSERAMGWMEDHVDDLATVRAGTDFAALARLRLGKKGSDGYYRTARFDWNPLGAAVRLLAGR